MRTVLMLRGIAGAGKSTFARDLMNRERDRWMRVNQDDIRMMLFPSQYTFTDDNEALVKRIHDDALRSLLTAGHDVIVDNTNLVARATRRTHSIAEEIGDVTVVEKVFHVDLAEALARNALREGRARVPDNIVTSMFKRAKGLKDSTTYYEPRCTVPMQQDSSLPKAIICDLDGTLALIGDRSPYDASQCEKDAPNVAVIECVMKMWQSGHRIIFVSGREDKYREQSVAFINRHCIDTDDQLIHSTSWAIDFDLHMRATGDFRKDAIIKAEIFEKHIAGKYNVSFVCDDRNQVVQMWRQMGLTCFQCAEGNF
jgi:predicted kinase